MDDVFEALVSFPELSHAAAVCKPLQGAETCRYLELTPDGSAHRCAKATSRRRTLDDHALQGTMTARGNNCTGILGELLERNGAFRGRRVSNRDPSDPKASGTFVELELQPETLSLTVDWDLHGRSRELFPTGCLTIDVGETYLTVGSGGFSNRGLTIHA